MLSVLADFPEFEHLTEELLKEDFEQFLNIYAIVQQKILVFSEHLSTDPTKADTLIKANELLLTKIRLVEHHQLEVKAALVNLTVSQKIQKKYMAE